MDAACTDVVECAMPGKFYASHLQKCLTKYSKPKTSSPRMILERLKRRGSCAIDRIHQYSRKLRATTSASSSWERMPWPTSPAAPPAPVPTTSAESALLFSRPHASRAQASVDRWRTSIACKPGLSARRTNRTHQGQEHTTTTATAVATIARTRRSHRLRDYGNGVDVDAMIFLCRCRARGLGVPLIQQGVQWHPSPKRTQPVGR